MLTGQNRPLTARETRCYVVDYEGDGAALATFLNKVLADPVSHALYSGSTPALHGYSFFLDYGMKSGALDLEKETIIAHHQGDASAAAGARRNVAAVAGLAVREVLRARPDLRALPAPPH